MENAHLFTNEHKIIRLLKKYITVNQIITEKKFLKNKNKKIKLVKNYQNFDRVLRNFKNHNLGIIYGFGKIFKKKQISLYKKGLWNIHPGDLPNYRGRHPITAAFLNDEKKIGVTVHIINEKIDRGYILSKTYVNRSYKDDEKTIKDKIIKVIPKLISKAFKNFQSNKLIKIKKGKFYKPFYNGINIQNSKKFEKKYIYNAVKAQKCYGGVKINGQIYKDAIFTYKKNKKHLFDTVVCKYKKKIYLLKK